MVGTASDVVANFTFHGITDAGRPPDDYWLTPKQLHRALDRLARLPGVGITFDDGYRSDVEHALPALAERGLTATFFVVAGRLGRPEFLCPSDLRTLLEAGMSLGSHGLGHRPWRGLAEEALRAEIVEARERLEEVAGVPITAAAAPFGAYDRRALMMLRASGYERVYTSDGGFACPGAWLQPRTTLRAGDVDSIDAVVAGLGSGRRRRALKTALKRWR